MGSPESSDFNKSFELLKIEEIQTDVEVIKLYDYPKTDGLGFMNRFLEHLDDLLKFHPEAIAIMKSQIESLHVEFDFLRNVLRKIKEQQHDENEEIRDLWIRIVGLAYQAEYIIDLYLVKSYPDSRIMFSLTKILEQTMLIKFEATIIYCEEKIDMYSTSIQSREVNFELKFPSSLRRLTLSYFPLRLDEISKMGRTLPNLEVLKINGPNNPYGTWVVDDGDFQKLRYLKLSFLRYIRDWKASADSLPVLEQLVLDNCMCLKEIPPCFKDIPTLQMITVKYCNSLVEYSAREIQRDQQEEWQNDELKVYISNPMLSKLYGGTDDKPMAIMHPKHKHYLVRLFRASYPVRRFRCDLCDRVRHYGGITYHCSHCEFELDVSCALQNEYTVVDLDTEREKQRETESETETEWEKERDSEIEREKWNRSELER